MSLLLVLSLLLQEMLLISRTGVTRGPILSALVPPVHYMKQACVSLSLARALSLALALSLSRSLSRSLACSRARALSLSAGGVLTDRNHRAQTHSQPHVGKARSKMQKTYDI